MTHWRYTVDLTHVFHNLEMTFEQRRDRIVGILRGSRWLKDQDQYEDIHGILDELSDAADVSEFDMAWNELYQVADADKAWLRTRG